MPSTTKDKDTKRARSSERSRSSDRSGSDRGARREGNAPRSGSSAAGGSSERRITAKNLTAEDRKFLEKKGSQLSPSTLRAKWIHSPDERPDRPGQTLATRSPEVVKAWAEARKGVPATVGKWQGDRPRTLRFDFPANGPSRRLEPIDWDSWLKTFSERDLVFIYQEERRDGRESNFFRLDSPEREEG